MRDFKLTFIGAGSTIFVKNVVGDCMLRFPDVAFEVALFDIDEQRLEESRVMLEYIAKKYHSKAKVVAYHNRKEAFKGADFIVNAIQVGGYESTLVDFEIPKKYGLRQTIADTLGIGGIFRALRTIPVLESMAEDIQECCPNALFLNYVNPMAILTKYLIEKLHVNTVGLCHSVQYCLDAILRVVDMKEYESTCQWKIAGINHQAWLLEIKDQFGNDLYPEIKKRSKQKIAEKAFSWDLVRHELMHRFGYYLTESSEHSSEYMPYFIKEKYPELIEKYNIPLDEYPRRCVKQINEWNERKQLLVTDAVEHTISNEFASLIIGAKMGGEVCRIHGNVMNNGLITNLPHNSCVEVPCLVDSSGVTPCYIGDLPEQCAALNRTNINVQNLAVEGAYKRSKELVYMAAYFDPHASSELSMDEIKAMCDELFEAHSKWLPKYN
jgi:alpha-galactosidase